MNLQNKSRCCWRRVKAECSFLFVCAHHTLNFCCCSALRAFLPFLSILVFSLPALSMYCCFFQVVSFGRFRFFCLETFFDFIFPSLSWSSHWSVCFDSIQLFYLSNAPGGTMQFSVPFSTSSFGEPLSSIYLCFHHVFFCFFCVSFDVFDPIFFFNFAFVDFFICIFLEGDVTVLVTI